MRKILFVFIVSLGAFLFLQSGNTFADPDSFYHLKLAQEGSPKSFPWLQFTTLKDTYTDQHYLYHLLLPETFQGAKIFTAVSGAIFVVVFYLLLASLGVRYAPWFSLMLLLMNPFMFRLSLVKASALALILLFLGITAAFHKKYFVLLALGFLYVWTHGGFVLLLIAMIFLWDFRGFLFSLGGIFFGLVLHPYFPQNVSFYWQQLVEIGLINYQDVIEVGAEWYPYPLTDLVGGLSIFFIFFLLASLLFIFFYKSQGSREKRLLFFSLFLLVFTLKSRRYVEYFVPVAWLWIALVFDRYFSGPWRAHLRSFFISWKKRKMWLSFLGVYFVITLSWTIGKGFLDNASALQEQFSLDHFERAMTYLQNNSEPGDIVFHPSWSDMPIMFYHNSKNYYLVGLDATFMYNFNQDVYEKWRDISSGKIKDHLAQNMREIFRARYALVPKEESSKLLWAYLKRDPEAKSVYEDEEAIVFAL